MPEFDLVTSGELAILRALARSGAVIDVCEMIAIRWPAPTGTRFYAHAQFDKMPNFQPLSVRGLSIEARLASGYFIELPFTTEIEDDTIPLELVDTDREMTRLLRTHREGIPVEVFNYFPQIDALVSLWWGHLRPPSEGGSPILKFSASSGFRSVLLNTPRRILYAGCQAIWGGHLKTLEEIAENACGWNLHLEGGNVGVPGSQLLGACPRRSRADCTAYLGDSLSILNAETVIESVYNGQSKGSGILATSKGNETNLKEPLRVIFGERVVRDIQPSGYLKQFNNNDPNKGFVRVQMPVCEGPIESMTEVSVNEVPVGYEHLNVRLGEFRQPPTYFTPNAANMSHTAHFHAVHGQVNPAGLNASNLKGKCRVRGLRNIRVYSDENTYIETRTDNRGWCLFEVERNKVWGRGKSISRVVMQDWLELGAWSNEMVLVRLANGTQISVKRSTFNAELIGRSTQQQINDICLFGRFGLPFRHNGKVRQLPLRKETIDASIPVFTDQGRDANICVGSDFDSLIFWSQISDAELPNSILLTFEDAAHGNIERPLTFDDQVQQLSAAEALGDTSLHVVQKRYSALGVTNEGEAIRVGWGLLNLGEFDGGGIKNNFRVRMIVPFYETLNLHRYKLIKIVSPKIEGCGFEYFRVMHRRRRSDLQAEIIAQAYPVDYYEELETLAPPPTAGGNVGIANPGGRRGARPHPIFIDGVDFNNDSITLDLRTA